MASLCSVLRLSERVASANPISRHYSQYQHPVSFSEDIWRQRGRLQWGDNIQSDSIGLLPIRRKEAPMKLHKRVKTVHILRLINYWLVEGPLTQQNNISIKSKLMFKLVSHQKGKKCSSLLHPANLPLLLIPVITWPVGIFSVSCCPTHPDISDEDGLASVSLWSLQSYKECERKSRLN